MVGSTDWAIGGHLGHQPLIMECKTFECSINGSYPPINTALTKVNPNTSKVELYSDITPSHPMSNQHVSTKRSSCS